MKKLILILLLTALTLSCLGIDASARFGSGYRIVGSEVGVVKTGLVGQKLTFTDSDFKSAYAITDFDSITVNTLPSSSEGALLLAGRRVKEGQRIKRRSIATLVFVPASAEVTEAAFEFTLKNGGSETVGTCRMRFIDRVNYAPSTPDEKEASLSLTTQAEISVFGRLAGSDPEGDRLEYIIAAYPKNGAVTFVDERTGRYKYTPSDSFTGYDSFTYVLRDEYGNYSEPCEVGIHIIERMSTEVFADMNDRSEYNAAIAMSAMGIMSARTLGDGRYFMPDDTVSKAEFVAMAMKVAGIKADTSLTKSYFDDNRDIPTALVSYVATAQRLGIIDGALSGSTLVFEPNKGITKNEAAAVMSAILGLGGSDEVCEYFDNATVGANDRASVAAMFTLGIFDGEISDYSGTDTVTRAEAAEYLYRI